MKNEKKDRSMVPILAAISLSFGLAIIVSIGSLTMLARENTKEIDTMVTYRVYDAISSNLNEPIIVAKTMACDEFLEEFLTKEEEMTEEEAVSLMQRYLSSVREGLEYDSAFLVSENSRRYYTYEGLNKIVDPENDAHDVWYSIFLDQNIPYDLDVDSDEVNQGQWTVFVNARIEDESGKLLGVCGVGVQMTDLQEMFLAEEQEYNVKINLVDPNGLVQVDTEDINIENAWLDTEVLKTKDNGGYVYQTTEKNEFAVSKYVEYLGWYLVVRSAPTTISREYVNIIFLNIGLFLVVLGILILMITHLLRRSRKERDDRERLLILSERAMAASEAKSSFLSSMSHEIRTPINAVLGMNEMILRETDDEKILGYSSNIKSAGKTLLSLINSILDFSKIEEGKMEIVPITYETSVMLANIVNSVRDRAKDKGLELILEIDSNLPVRMVGDDLRIQQVIVNLLTNAVKYTEEGSVRFIFHEVKREGEDIDLYVAVEDTGIGIKDEDMTRLFESFERLDEEKNHSIEGTGLGMAIVTSLLRMMGSEIHVKSEYGEGSTFSFTIRQKIADEAEMGEFTGDLTEGHPIEKPTLPVAANARVLVVDDNVMNLKVAQNLLGLFGIKAELSESGFDAIERLQKEHFDLILLDHMMPRMDGKETLRKMKADGLLPSDTRVVALTANAINGAREEYLSCGFDDYIAKPMEIENLEEVLKRWLPEGTVTENGGTAAGEQGEPAFLRVLREAGIDVDAGLSFCADDPEFYREMLSDYAAEMEERRAELDALLEAKNWPDFKIKIHALKSTSKTIGAMDLFDKALDLEHASAEAKEDYIPGAYATFVPAYEKIVMLIRSVVA